MRADSARHNEQQQERGVKHSSNVGEMDGVWNGKGNRKTEGAGSKRKTAGQRLRGQNLQHIRAERIFFISLLTGTYTVGIRGRGRGEERGREEGKGAKEGGQTRKRKTENRQCGRLREGVEEGQKK